MERLMLFARAFGLTVRKTELLEHLTTGADTRDLARAPYVSEHTVQDHIKSIFSKTGANSRNLLPAGYAVTHPVPASSARRQDPIQHSDSFRNGRFSVAPSTHLPFRSHPPGVMPPMGAVELPGDRSGAGR